MKGLLGDILDRVYIDKLLLFNQFVAPEIKDVIVSLDLQVGQSVLDAGCGIGMITGWLSAHVLPKGAAVGVDLSFPHVTYARKTNPYVLQGDLLKLPFAPDTFDLIWCSNTINHLINPLETVNHFKALLKANGRLVIGQSGFLAEMFFAWDARLEREVMLANRRYYRDKYGLSEHSMSNYRSWFGLLREAGFTQVTAKTITIERTMPLTHNDEVYFIECVFNGYWAHRVKPYLSQEDWQELQDLCDPQSPKFCLKRRDFHHIQTYTIVIGSIVRQ